MTMIKAQLQSKKLMFAMVLFLASIVFVATGQADFGQWAEFVNGYLEYMQQVMLVNMFQIKVLM